ncbi:MFS transporter [Kribbella sp. NPDC054772]
MTADVQVRAVPAVRVAERAWWPVGLAMLVIGWGGNQFTPLLMVYRQHGGFSQLDVDVFLGAYVVGLVPGLLIASGLSDHFGRRPLMLVGLASSFTGSALLALGDVAGYPALFAGRALSGIAVGIAMAVGTAWVTELSAYATPGAGARRSAILLTTGFAAGPASAGLLAEWTSPALVWPYVVHLALCLPALWLVLTSSVETRRESGKDIRLLDRLRVPGVAHRRFLHVVLPMAPWIFGSAGVAYAIVPQVVDASLGKWALLFTSGLTVATLVTGVLVQPIARRLDDRSTARAVVVSMAVMTVGMALAALTAVVARPWLAVPVALVLGAAYGIAVVSGLLEVQRMARPEDLSRLTGVYYALAYVGFLLPATLAFLGHWFGLPAMLTAVALTCLACTLTSSSGWSRHLVSRS